jgi:hypothetical protein
MNSGLPKGLRFIMPEKSSKDQPEVRRRSLSWCQRGALLESRGLDYWLKKFQKLQALKSHQDFNTPNSPKPQRYITIGAQLVTSESESPEDLKLWLEK